MPQFSQRAVALHPVVGGPPQDDMVEHLDAQQNPGPQDLTRDADIGLRRARIPAGMIVNQDDGVGTGGNGRSKNLSGVHQDLIDEALGDRLHANEATTGIEQEHHHPLSIPTRRGVGEQGRDARRGIEERGRVDGLPGHPTTQFQGRHEDSRLSGTHAPEASQLAMGGPVQRGQTAEVTMQRFANGHGIGPRQPSPQ